MTGLVKSLKAVKGYGFIKADVTNTEYFFHRDDFNGHWDDLAIDFESKKMNIEVSFDISQRKDRGPRAANVKRTDGVN